MGAHALWAMSRHRVLSATQRAFFGGASFWHTVDLLRIVIFPLVFLVRVCCRALIRAKASVAWLAPLALTVLSWVVGTDRSFTASGHLPRPWSS